MLTTIRNAWKIKDLRRKILFTLLIILLYRIGNAIPVPYINTTLLNQAFNERLSQTILGLYNVMSGSALANGTILALSIQPYINASIIIELLCIAIPALERLQKDGGEEGRKKIASITRYSTVALGLLMGFAYWMMLKNYNTAYYQGMLLKDTGFMAAITVILTFGAGSALVMWLGEQITEFGIGNGISMILFANIISRLPEMVTELVQFTSAKFQEGVGLKWIWFPIVVVIGMLALVVFIVFITQAERRIPVSYAKRVVGRKVYGGQNTHLPIKVNMSGVLPVIFAQSVISLPETIVTFLGKSMPGWLSSRGVLYCIIYALLIIAFSYFYATIQYNPVEISNNLQKNGGFIPGYRPGRPTSNFILKTINKITLFGAIFLGIVALLPMIAGIFTQNYNLAHEAEITAGTLARMPSLSVGGTSIIIVVGVALETVQAMEAQMMMRHYKGFLE